MLIVFLNPPDLTVAITGGLPVAGMPFFVSVLHDRTECGGAIVASQVVLTAARCLHNVDQARLAFPFEVRVVKVNFSNPNWPRVSYHYPCENFSLHPLFDPLVKDVVTLYDVALLKLPGGLDLGRLGYEKIRPCLDSHNYANGVALGMGMFMNVVKVLQGLVLLHRQPRCGDFFFHCWILLKLRLFATKLMTSPGPLE